MRKKQHRRRQQQLRRQQLRRQQQQASKSQASTWHIKGVKEMNFKIFTAHNKQTTTYSQTNLTHKTGTRQKTQQQPSWNSINKIDITASSPTISNITTSSPTTQDMSPPQGFCPNCGRMHDLDLASFPPLDAIPICDQLLYHCDLCDLPGHQSRFCADYTRIMTTGHAEQVDLFGQPSGRTSSGRHQTHLAGMSNTTDSSLCDLVSRYWQQARCDASLVHYIWWSPVCHAEAQRLEIWCFCT